MPDSNFYERKQKETIRRREVRKEIGVPLPPLVKLPYRQQPGVTIEREYFSAIQRLLDPYYKAIKEILIPVIPRVTQSFENQTRVDDFRKDNYWEIISRAIKEVGVAVGIGFVDGDIEREARRIGTRTSDFNRNQMNNQFRSVLGVNPLRNESYLESQVASFTARNASLIKSIPSQSLSRVETLVRTSVEAGETASVLAGKIKGEMNIARRRAALIARDQINKFNGKLTELRQTEVGVEEYIWSSSKDERVRENHRSKDGKRFSWKTPPSDTGHPGEDINCRCVAIPILNYLKAPPGISSLLPLGAIIAGNELLLEEGDEQKLEEELE